MHPQQLPRGALPRPRLPFPASGIGLGGITLPPAPVEIPAKAGIQYLADSIVTGSPPPRGFRRSSAGPLPILLNRGTFNILNISRSKFFPFILRNMHFVICGSMNVGVKDVLSGGCSSSACKCGAFISFRAGSIGGDVSLRRPAYPCLRGIYRLPFAERPLEHRTINRAQRHYISRRPGRQSRGLFIATI